MTTWVGTHYILQPMPKRLLAKGSFKVELYGVTVNIYVMATIKEVATKVKQLCKKIGLTYQDILSEACGYTATFTTEPYYFHVVYCIECMDVNTITHEVDHLRKYILEHAGIVDDEASAILSGYLNEKVFEFLRKNNYNI